jgi:hypothetical protein
MTLLFFVLCQAKAQVSSVSPYSEPINISYNRFSLKEALAVEQAISSKDISDSYQTRLKREDYSNKKKYPLAPAKAFLRLESPWFANRVEYYYDSRDSSVRAIVYEWNDLKENAIKNDKDIAVKLAAFQEKFDLLAQHITFQLGMPGFLNLESRRQVTIYKDEKKWIDQEEMNVSLSIVVNKDMGFSQIKLVVYKD